ncbi:MAG: helix-turn-helix transcriptional regulator [Candidatus Kapabacteria bacterium]|nr:helix-turn-helix transcriptional regulator [Candidatus Kapabacteria bacterium]
MERIDQLVSKMQPHERMFHEWQFALSRRLQQIMEERNLTQRELARISQLTEPQVSAIIHLDANPTLAVLARISALLNADLFEWINSDLHVKSGSNDVIEPPHVSVDG